MLPSWTILRACVHTQNGDQCRICALSPTVAQIMLITSNTGVLLSVVIMTLLGDPLLIGAAILTPLVAFVRKCSRTCSDGMPSAQPQPADAVSTNSCTERPVASHSNRPGNPGINAVENIVLHKNSLVGHVCHAADDCEM